MRPTRPEFVPDPSLSRAEMESLQREVAAAADFSDDLSFEPASVSLATESLVPADDRPLVAGVDQAFLDDHAVSAVVVLRGGEVVERAHAVSELSIPYIPGLLSFREGGPILDAVAELDCEPDLFVFDGSGRIHFRQAGLATHMGVVLDTPAIGVAKSLLCGEPRESVDERPEGWQTPVVAADGVEPRAGVDGDGFAETVVGYAYQSRQYPNSMKINPLYVSPGHRVSAETTVELVARLGGEYKLPEPTRLADSYADEVKRDY
ncbi:Endonuclease V [Halogranum gelatinilyticum]|uniref:Endonuclease V n=1 Tax=Halogranum gelatinilyticum TaxID=660521 RepID=A0A1G9QKA9_9EURY|nr:endonuclease V [Halogranum gelatinilyticum]SDM11426.1 Endonuclease V [Halogranum gelatinilyticum]